MPGSIWSKVRIKLPGHGEIFSEWKLDWLCTFIKEGDLFNFKPKPDWLLWPSAIKTIARDYNSWIWVTFMGDLGKIGGFCPNKRGKSGQQVFIGVLPPAFPQWDLHTKSLKQSKYSAQYFTTSECTFLVFYLNFSFYIYTQLYNAAEKVHVQYAPTNYHPAHIFSAL